MQTYTKQSLIEEFQKIAARGWIKNARRGNDGGVGNTLEDLLGIEENNLPIPNANEWELKSQRSDTSSLTTLFHMEPSPRAMKFVPQIFLPFYGWKHKEAGKRHPENEMSFRQTIHGGDVSDRGFTIKIDRSNRKVLVSFDSTKVAAEHSEWLNGIPKGKGELDPQPYWGFDDLAAKVRAKLLNCFYAQAEVKVIDGEEYYLYSKVLMLQNFSFDKFLDEFDAGNVLVDFDARTGHNHGSKFRLRQNCLPNLYGKATVVVGAD